MSIEVESLGEVFNILKQYIPQKDRQEAADTLMGFLVDELNDMELKELAGIDPLLMQAYKEYASEFDDDDEYSDEYED